MAFIEIKNYSKEIKSTMILNNISLELECGKVYGFHGRNGCGKSMLFKAICGLIHASEGDIIIDSKKLHEDIEIPESIGALIENPGFFPQLNGYENLMLLANINKRVSKEVVIELLEQVHLNNKKKYKQYSLGMKQRLGIIQAFMENPDILILDEPMNALDEEHITLVKEMILEKKAQQKCILLASHNKEDLEMLCDVIYHMEDGCIKGVMEV